MTDEQPDKETEVTPEGAVEVNEEDLDQASGGAAYLKMPVDQLKLNPGGEVSVKIDKSGYDLKGYDLKKI